MFEAGVAKLLAAALFIVAYIFLIIYYDRKHYIVWAAALLGGLLGLISFNEAVTAISWNVMGVFVGTMVVAAFFIESNMTSYLANVMVSRTKRIWMAILLMCMLSGFVSIFAENVATVLILAPIALSIAHKLKTSAVPFLIGIAVSSNLQGAGTLIGDPPSMILAGYAKLTFNQFFFLNGKPSIFFAVQIGALVSMFVLYFLFRKYRQKTIKVTKEKVKSYFPTILIIALIVSLALSSSFDPGFVYLAGTLCMMAAAIGTVWYYYWVKDVKKARKVIRTRVDWSTSFFLMGIFVMVGILEHNSVISWISGFVGNLIGDNLFLGFLILVWFSVLVSAFVDNVPYLATMVPVAASLAASVGVEPYVLFFGLLIGASVGGNITPIGAAANIVAMGLLKKEGYKVTFWQYVKIGLPFTVISTLAATMVVWWIWG